MPSNPQTVRIDIVSDIVCPWCIVGYRQLLAAIESSGIETEIHWHPFELNPHMPPEGQNIREHVAEKYGSSKADSDRVREQLSHLGAQLGFAFNFTDDSRIYNTFEAHQLIHWAETKGQGNTLKQALFSAYFSDQHDVSNRALLAQTAQSIGLDHAEATKILADQRYGPAVRERQAHWVEQGIQGVPAVVFNEKYLVSGAQGAEQFERCLQEVINA